MIFCEFYHYFERYFSGTVWRIEGKWSKVGILNRWIQTVINSKYSRVGRSVWWRVLPNFHICHSNSPLNSSKLHLKVLSIKKWKHASIPLKEPIIYFSFLLSRLRSTNHPKNSWEKCCDLIKTRCFAVYIFCSIPTPPSGFIWRRLRNLRWLSLRVIFTKQRKIPSVPVLLSLQLILLAFFADLLLTLRNFSRTQLVQLLYFFF